MSTKKHVPAPSDDEAQPSPTKKSTEDLKAAVSALNDDLKASSPDLGKTPIEPVKDDDKLDLDTEETLSDEIVDEIEASENDASDAQLSEDSTDDDSATEAEPKETLEDNHEAVAEESIPDDDLTEEAIKEIVAQESDVVLEAEDQTRDIDSGVLEETKEQKRKGWLANFFSSSRSRWILFGGLAAILLAIGLFPYSRYFVLNNVGVRSTLSLRVIDTLTRQPLKNVSVRAGGSSGMTDTEGNITLEEVLLGSTRLQIEKRAFATIERNITIGWGSNPLGEFEAEAIGTQYTFVVTDFLSGKPIEGAEIGSGEGDASSDKDGKAVLTLDTADVEDDAQIKVEFRAKTYRTESFNMTANNKEEQSVQLIPDRKHVYVSKRSGTYDIYTAHVDGKNEKKLVTGTGLERDDLVLVPHQKDEVAAFVATRENVRNSSGYLLSTLYVLNTSKGELVKIDQSEQIQVVGWSQDGHLVYVKIAAGADGTDPKRHRIMSFNHKDFSDVKELASSNSFNDVTMADSRVFYATSNVFKDKTTDATLMAVNPDGGDKQTILDKEVYTIVRSGYETLDLNVGEEWFTYKLGSSEQAKSGSAPSSEDSRIYADNNDTNFSLWRDSRDGRGVLVSYDKKAKKESVLTSRNGLNLPLYWLNNKYVVFRVSDNSETADYVLNIEGGDPRKITDVTDTSGLDRWFYY